MCFNLHWNWSLKAPHAETVKIEHAKAAIKRIVSFDVEKGDAN
jgi:hypothetical protein